MKLNDLLEANNSEELIWDGNMDMVNQWPPKIKQLMKQLFKLGDRAKKHDETMVRLYTKRENLIEKALKYYFIYDKGTSIEDMAHFEVDGYPLRLVNKRNTMIANAHKQSMEVIYWSAVDRVQLAVIKKNAPLLKIVQQLLKLETRLNKAYDDYLTAQEKWIKKSEQINKAGVVYNFEFGNVIA